MSQIYGVTNIVKKIIAGLLIAIALCVAMAMIAVQFPTIQTSLAKKATLKISKRAQGNISIGKVCYAPLNKIILKELLVKENNGDTLLYMEKLLADVKVLSVLTGKLKINRVSLSNGEFNLRNYSKDTTNLSLFLSSLASNEPSTEVKDELLEDEDADGDFSIFVKSIMVENLAFSMVNPYAPPPHRSPNAPPVHHTAKESPTAIEWDNLGLSEINLYANNFTFGPEGMDVHLNELSFKEKKGLNVHKICGDVSLRTDSLKLIKIDNLKIIDDYSDVTAPYFSMEMDSFEDFSDYVNKVVMGLDLDDALLDFRTLHYFAPGIEALTLKLYITGETKGSVSDLRSKSLKVFSGSKKTYLEFAAHLLGLPESSETMAGFEIKDCYTTTSDLEQIINQVTPVPLPKNTIAKFAPDEKFTFKGSLNGLFEDFVAFGELSSANLGGVHVDIICRNDRKKGYEIIGGAQCNSFGLGEFLQNDTFGNLCCNASLSALLGKKNIDVTLDDLKITEFGFNNYNYSNISAMGRLNGNEFDGRVISSDPNLNFMFHGLLSLGGKKDWSQYKFNLTLGYANLHALNFDKRDISAIQMRAEANIKQAPSGDMFGDATIKDLSGTVGTNNIKVGDILLRSLSTDNNYRLSLNSSFAKANYSGTAPISTFIDDLLKLTLNEELSNLLDNGGKVKKAEDYSENVYSLKIDTYNTKPICDFFMPSLYISDSSKVRLNIDRTGNLDADITSSLVAIGDKYIKGLNLNLDNQGDKINTNILVDLLQSGELRARDNAISAVIDTNHIDFRYTLGKDTTIANRADINAFIHFPAKEESDYFVEGELKRSQIVVDNAKWEIVPCKISYKENKIAIDKFKIECGEQSLFANGTISPSTNAYIGVLLNKFDLSLLNSFTSMPLQIKGHISGKADAFGLLGQDLGLMADVDADSLSLSGEEVGNMKIISRWDDQNKKFNLFLTNRLNERRPINLSASYTPSNKEISANAYFNKFALSYFAPILTTVVSDVSGSLSGEVKVSGTLDKLKIDSKDCAFEDLACKLLFTQVPYTINGPFSISEKGVVFQNMEIKDKYGHTGRISGGVDYDRFKNIKLNTRINVTDILALNTTAKDNSSFYGRAFGTGLIRISGPAENMMLDINVTTKNNSNVHIPLGGAAQEQTSLLTFINNKVEKLSAYDSLLLRNEEIKKVAKKSELGVKVRVNATPDAEIHLEINKSLGDVLKARGSGQIEINVAPQLFDIKGHYGIDEGSYKFVLMGLASRDFSINPGGSINFNGDIMQSDLNLTATYRTKASIGTLISDTTSIGTRRNVDCGIGITGKLSNPQLNFSIDIPDLDPNTKDRVESALNTEDKRLKQVLTLLLSGSFIPDEQSGIVNNTTILYSNASEIMANQLNNIFRQLDIPVDLGFNYQKGQNGRDIFDVAISTQLFNNRVTINGNIGNRQYMSTSNSNLVGDVDVEIKLNESGKLRLNLFSHSADQFSNFLDQTQRNGAGILFQEEFDNFKELWRKIFWKKSRREEYEREQLMKIIRQRGEQPRTNN